MPDRTRLTPRGSRMSPKERQALKLLARGLKPIQIAGKLGVTASYVYSLIRMLRARFDAQTNEEMMSRSISEGLIATDGEWVEPDEPEDDSGGEGCAPQESG